MDIKTQPQLEQDLVQNVIAQSNDLTYFGRGGVVRSVLRALSGLLAEAYNDIVQTKRSMFIDLSTGADLDTIGARRGVPRRAASASSVILVFNGTANTLIPAGTQVRSKMSNTIFQTMFDLVIADKNVDYAGEATDLSLADTVIAESLLPGSLSAVPANSITEMVVPIGDVTVNNPAPSEGGLDVESDASYRERLKSQISLLSQDTNDFYNALAMQANTDVLRAVATRLVGRREIVYLVKNSGAPFQNAELVAIGSYMQSKTHALHPITGANLDFTLINITFSATLEQGATLADIQPRLASVISAYIDWRYWNQSDPVSYDQILSLILADPGIHSIDPDTYVLNGNVGDVVIDANSLPRFAQLSITDLQDGTSTVQISQRYLSIPI